jgi:hypothetical protein
MKKLHLGEETTTEEEEKHWELFVEDIGWEADTLFPM